MATPRVGVAAPSAGVGVPAGAPALAAPALPINQPTPAGAVIGPITLQSVIPWVNGVVAPAASLTAPPVGNANGFTNGELPNGASTKQFTIPANPAVAASVPANGQLPTTGSACKPWQPPAANVGANVWVLGCIGVPGGWACSDTQLASPAATPSCFVENLNPECMQSAYVVPPPAPGSAPAAILGCTGAGPSSPAVTKFQCAMGAKLNPTAAETTTGATAIAVGCVVPSKQTVGPASNTPVGGKDPAAGNGKAKNPKKSRGQRSQARSWKWGSVAVVAGVFIGSGV